MVLWMLVSCIAGVSIGLTLRRGVRILAGILLALSVTPLALLWAASQLGLLPNDSNEGILAMMILLILAPGAIAMFIAAWFRD